MSGPLKRLMLPFFVVLVAVAGVLVSLVAVLVGCVLWVPFGISPSDALDWCRDRDGWVGDVMDWLTA